MPAACAIDFGTSNTAVCLVRDGVATPVPVEGEALTPTLMLFRPGKAPTYGRAAMNAYLEGDLEGRLVQSVKRHLPAATFEGSAFGSAVLTLEGIVAGFLAHLKRAVDAAAGEPVDRVLLGRPARFSTDPERDALAQGRLEAAARAAGFREIAFEVEPVAAARAFEATLDRDVLCLVGDLGGGTSDFTLMRLGPGRAGDRREDVLGVSGLDVAGNDFDARLVWAKAVPHFGVHAKYRPFDRWVEIPTSLHHAVCRWHTLCQASTPKTFAALDRMLRTADDREGLLRLRELIAHNLGFLLFRSVERCKIDLGEHEASRLRFERDGIDLDEPVARAELEAAAARELQRLDASVAKLLADSGVDAGEVDVVFLTGGTSRIPAVRGLFHARFPGRIVDQDAFLSVATGLGLAAVERFA